MNTIISQIESIIAEAEAMKSAYFFRSPAHAGARRSYERQHTHEPVEWTDGGHIYTAAYTVTCSCSNVYAYGTYTKDGNKTTLTAIKNSLNRLKNNA